MNGKNAIDCLVQISFLLFIQNWKLDVRCSMFYQIDHPSTPNHTHDVFQ